MQKLNEVTLQDFTSLKTAAAQELSLPVSDRAEFTINPALIVRACETIEELQAQILSGGSSKGGPVPRRELEQVLGSLTLVYDSLAIARQILNPSAFPGIELGMQHLTAVYSLISGRLGMATTKVGGSSAAAAMTKTINDEVRRQSAPAGPFGTSTTVRNEEEHPLSEDSNGIQDESHYGKVNDFGSF